MATEATSRMAEPRQRILPAVWHPIGHRRSLRRPRAPVHPHGRGHAVDAIEALRCRQYHFCPGVGAGLSLARLSAGTLVGRADGVAGRSRALATDAIPVAIGIGAAVFLDPLSTERGRPRASLAGKSHDSQPRTGQGMEPALLACACERIPPGVIVVAVDQPDCPDWLDHMGADA